jgi:hypothetical protein
MESLVRRLPGLTLLEGTIPGIHCKEDWMDTCRNYFSKALYVSKFLLSLEEICGGAVGTALQAGK